MKQWRKNNPEKIKELHRRYSENNREKINRRHGNRLKKDIKFNLNHRMRYAIWDSLRGNKNGRRWETLVGYDVFKLKNHLQKTMPKYYTWQDYLNGKLHIDHILPKSVFNFDCPEHPDFKRCWALKNLRLLPAKENLIKHNKLIKPFQPSLKISI